MNFDAVVIGSGAAGLTAAIVAAKNGLSVLLLESTGVIGGTSAISGGAVWIPENHLAKEAGSGDTSAKGADYLRAVLGNQFDEAKIGAYLRNSPAMLRFMMDNTEVKFMPVPVADYTLDVPGWANTRVLMPMPYDGNRLGGHFRKLRRPVPEMGLFSGMQVPHLDIMPLRFWNRSAANFIATSKLMLGYAWDKVRHGKGARLGNGNALVARLFRSAIDSGVTIWTEASAVELTRDGDRVTGVVCSREGKQVTVAASKGVVLATGGCGANPEMRRKYLPDTVSEYSLQPEGCQGDGLRLGESAGGHVVQDNYGNAIWVPMSTTIRRDGSRALFPSLTMDRHCPGSLMVNAATGKRFVNESQSYQHFGRTTIHENVSKSYIISDADAVRKYGLGMAKPAPFSIRPWVEKGYIVEAQTIGELAQKIGIDPKTLEQTVADFNRHAASGTDPDFNRGGDVLSAANGDWEHKPNPTLGALEKGPFYALEIVTGDLSILAGLETNAEAQVVNTRGEAIPGLYAAGLDNNTPFRGHYPGGGSSIGLAMTFGYVAGRHMAGASLH